MNLLITNDDGIFAEGIQVLAQTLLANNYSLHLVAPDHEQSATGHAITMHRPLRAEKVKFMHNNEIEGWAVNGTPSDCVKLAVEAILPVRPDMVISGINNGDNLGTDVLYSGTVSAAVEAAMLGIPALAVSLCGGNDYGFDYAAAFVARLLPVIRQAELPGSTLLNINIPGCHAEAIKGVAITRLGTRRYRNPFQERRDPRGRSYHWLAGELIDGELEQGSDVAAVKKGYISITPVHFDLTDYQALETLSARSFDNVHAGLPQHRQDSDDHR